MVAGGHGSVSAASMICRSWSVHCVQVTPAGSCTVAVYGRGTAPCAEVAFPLLGVVSLLSPSSKALR